MMGKPKRISGPVEFFPGLGKEGLIQILRTVKPKPAVGRTGRSYTDVKKSAIAELLLMDVTPREIQRTAGISKTDMMKLLERPSLSEAAAKNMREMTPQQKKELGRKVGAANKKYWKEKITPVERERVRKLKSDAAKRRWERMTLQEKRALQEAGTAAAQKLYAEMTPGQKAEFVRNSFKWWNNATGAERREFSAKSRRTLRKSLATKSTRELETYILSRFRLDRLALPPRLQRHFKETLKGIVRGVDVNFLANYLIQEKRLESGEVEILINKALQIFNRFERKRKRGAR